MPDERYRRRSSTARAGASTTLIAFLSAGIGFVFQAVIAARLGVDAFADAFQLTWAIVTFGTVTLFSLVLSLLVPRVQVDEGGVVSLGDAALPASLGLALSLIQVFVGLALGPTPLGIMLLWASPCSLLAGLTAMPQAVAYIQHRFALAAMGAVGNGLGLLIATLLLPSPSAMSLGLALTIGYVVQLATATVPFLWERPTFVSARSIPWLTFLGVSAYTLLAKFQPLMERLLTTSLVVGATAVLGFGQKTAQGILLVASFGLALTATAALSRHVNTKDFRAAGAMMSRTLAATTWLSVATCAAAMPLAWPATVLLFYRGEFTFGDARDVSDSTLLLLPWVLAGAVTGVFTSYLYIQRSYVRVIGAAFVGIVVTLVTTVLVAASTPMFAVAIGSSAGAVASLIWAVLLVKRSPIATELMNASRTYAAVFVSAVSIGGVALVSYVLCRLYFGDVSTETTVVPLVVIALTLLASLVSSRFRVSAKELIGAQLH